MALPWGVGLRRGSKDVLSRPRKWPPCWAGSHRPPLWPEAETESEVLGYCGKAAGASVPVSPTGVGRKSTGQGEEGREVGSEYAKEFRTQLGIQGSYLPLLSTWLHVQL